VRHLAESRNPSIINLSSAAGRFGFPLRTPMRPRNGRWSASQSPSPWSSDH
jgi:hypothetical protein